MSTTLELPDHLFARFKARAASQRLTLRAYVEQIVSAAEPAKGAVQQSAFDLPRLGGEPMNSPDQLSNAGVIRASGCWKR